MNVHNLLRWTHDESQIAYGEHSAFNRCHEEMKRMIEADDIEMRVVLASVPAPSDAERATWPKATQDYVEMLESLADGRISNKSD